ncbi:MAG: hypothetical protein AAGI34_05810 [Pseudomonadota bacterium]
MAALGALLAFTGIEDAEVRPEEISGWSGQTADPFQLVTVPGGRFFLGKKAEEMRHTIARTVSEPA